MNCNYAVLQVDFSQKHGADHEIHRVPIPRYYDFFVQ